MRERRKLALLETAFPTKVPPAMVAYYIHDLSPFLVRFNEQFGVRWYGLSYLAAFLAAYWVVGWMSRRKDCDIPPDRVGDFITGCAIFGVLLGGRLGYMVFYDLNHFLSNPLVFFRVWDGGMSAHGGILGVMFYTLWYARRHRVAWRNIGDNLVVAAPLGLFFGRVANFINGELYGRITNVAWAVQFPKELYEAPPGVVERLQADAVAINPQWTTVEDIIANAGTLHKPLAELLAPRHPSQLYEAGLEGLLLFAILLTLRLKFRCPNGVITGAFFLGYAVLRSFGEFFREPDAPLTGALTRGQFLSIFLALIGLGFLISAWLKPAWPVGRRT